MAGMENSSEELAADIQKKLDENITQWLQQEVVEKESNRVRILITGGKGKKTFTQQLKSIYEQSSSSNEGTTTTTSATTTSSSSNALNNENIGNTVVGGVVSEEVNLNLEKKVLEFIHIGGQRNQKRKWIHMLDIVEFVMFIVPLDSFLRNVSNNEKKISEMDYCLSVFEEMIHYFKNKRMVLVFNCLDLMQEEFKSNNLQMVNYFSDYNLSNTVDDAVKYFAAKYKKIYSDICKSSNCPQQEDYFLIYSINGKDSKSVETAFEKMNQDFLSKLPAPKQVIIPKSSSEEEQNTTEGILEEDDTIKSNDNLE